jgi:hypothetical protein
LKHFAAPEFWVHYNRLPEMVRDLADKKFELLKSDPRHSSIRLKKIGRFWSARKLAFIIEHLRKNVPKDSCGFGSVRMAPTTNTNDRPTLRYNFRYRRISLKKRMVSRTGWMLLTSSE